MARDLSPFAFFMAAIIFTLTLLSASVVAPVDPYYRWQELTAGTTRIGDWIYERLHFDPKPIDIALIGTSRTQTALSAPDIEHTYCEMTGRQIHVANLAVPETGRNMQYVIAKAAISAKKPAITFVELNEYEPRKPHRNFVVLADAKDVLGAPLFINTDYFSDIIRLPGRQAMLLFRSITQRPAVRTRFDKAAYKARLRDHTKSITFTDGRVATRFVVANADDLEKERAAIARRSIKLHLPGAFKTLEYRFSRLYLRKIERLAAASGGSVEYFFLPAYKAPAFPEDLGREIGINAPDIDLGGADVANDPDLFLNATHMNAWGAEIETMRFAHALARNYPGLGVKGCATR